MSLAARLVAMPTLIALLARALVALITLPRAAGLRRRGRRCNYFFLRFCKLYFALVVMTVCAIFALVHVSTGRSGRLVLARASSSSSTSASGKLTARLAFRHVRFGVCIFQRPLSIAA